MIKNLDFPEALLHSFWQMSYFSVSELQTSCGQPIQIINKGRLNDRSSGPDFLEAHLRIGSTLWVGHVEIHKLSSDWYKHQHQNDRAYNTVILHVVYREDRPVYRSTGQRIPCLVLEERIAPDFLQAWQRLLKSQSKLPCQELLPRLPRIQLSLYLESLSIERLAYKTQALALLHKQSKGSWQETFHQALARGLGLPLNAEPMELLARQIPWKLVLKHRKKLDELEALFLGQAGFLEGDFSHDAYAGALQKTYQYLQHKYQLPSPLPRHLWHFARMRPGNFPSLRLAQWARFLHQNSEGFDFLIQYPHWPLWRNWLSVELSGYWLEHNIPGKKAKMRKQKHLGEESIRRLTVNVLAPLLFLYGKEQDQERYQEQALALLEAIRPENNSVLRMWKQLGIVADSARRGQALLHLYKHYCQARKCMHCPIAHYLLGSTKHSDGGLATAPPPE